MSIILMWLYHTVIISLTEMTVICSTIHYNMLYSAPLIQPTPKKIESKFPTKALRDKLEEFNFFLIGGGSNKRHQTAIKTVNPSCRRYVLVSSSSSLTLTFALLPLFYWALHFYKRCPDLLTFVLGIDFQLIWEDLYWSMYPKALFPTNTEKGQQNMDLNGAWGEVRFGATYVVVCCRWYSTADKWWKQSKENNYH